MAVRAIPLPPTVAEASALRRLDYSDCFVIPGAADGGRVTAETWVRQMLERAPGFRRALPWGWRALRLDFRNAPHGTRVLGGGFIERPGP